ncbi:hypothetical protein BG006_010818 [Podila minutissima]|uniref:Uncharacterized protein n=1 Tax=Podila minutissima TaxID=64525 RepID=A0A9P5SGE8_9FUNG|nr:hypothetical protein BG006_010818 [Podila minutissima]
MVRLFLEQNPPSEAVHATVVGFIVLIFIVARVLTTRGFAAFRPGVNLRAIVTWLSVMSLTLMVIYSALLARLLFTQSMAGSYQAPEAPPTLYDPPSDIATNITWPVKVDLEDMSSNRIILKLSQCGLMSSLLLLNTYWCHHVEMLVDEGNFMSKSEMFMYWGFAGVVLVLPMAVLLGVGLGLGNWKAASNASDICLLLFGLVVIIGYILTCRRLQALERDSRNVNGGDTSTTLQLAYYIYCVYWLLGSFAAIMILGVLYKIQLVNPEEHLVLAQAINDLQGALWSTLIIMVYPAAMFLLYPSVDVLTQPEYDPGSRFQKRDKKSVKDAKRIRESLYLEGDFSHSVDGHHSSLHGLTTRPSLTLQQQQQVQQQILHDQQQFIHYRRERMGSLTAAVNEMQLIEEEEAKAGSIEMTGQPSAAQKESLKESQSAYKDKAWGDKTNGSEQPYGSGTGSYVANPVYETEDAKVNKWMTQHGDMDRAGLIDNLEMTLPPDQQQKYTWNNSSSPSMSPPSTYASIPMENTTTPSNTGLSKEAPAPASAHATTTSSTSKSTPKPVAPLTGILKTRNSTGSTRSSVGQNPFELATLASPLSRAPLSHANLAPAYGARTSSVQTPAQVASPRRSSENALVKRRASNSGKSQSASSTPSPNPTTDSPSPSPSGQQRRSNVTARVDASALALAAQQQVFQHHPNLPQTPPFKSRTSKDGSEGVEIDYFGIRSASLDMSHASSTPTEIQQLALSPPMTGFLMADPYPSAGTRFDQDVSTTLSLSDSQEDVMAGIDSYSKRSGANVSSKKYRAPPPPIPTGGSYTSPYRSYTVPTTPTTPITPPGVRPHRSVDAIVDRKLLEMAGRMYEDHVVPAHILQSASAKSSPQTETPPSGSETSGQKQSQPTQPQSPTRAMSPPLKSPHRVRESFENRGQGSDPATPPSPASTASPTIQSSSTLPRPLTPAWYETKTNFASTNEVLNHYNAVMRGGSFHKQQEQQQQQQRQQQQQQQEASGGYYSRAVGPLDTVGPEYTYTQTPTAPAPVTRPSFPQERTGSADSFGVVRRSSSSRKPFDSDKPIAPPAELSLTHQVPHRQQPQADRHSFMMPSESISAYSTWTGDLSDVTNTSGEVSVGAFADRKQATSNYHPNGSSGSSDKDHSDEHDVRKSQASGYSMGSSFGAGGSSPRQSAGGYSNYSNNSGPLVVPAGLSSVGTLQLPQGSPSSSKRQTGPKNRGSSSGTGSGHSSFTGSSSGNSGGVIGTPIANKMNQMRLSAFGPGEEDADVARQGRGSDAGIGSSREFCLGETDPVSEELEKVTQHEWLDRRTAVKKDSKNRLEQLQKQQALDDPRGEQERQQQIENEANVSRRRQEHLEEPYSLNSVYFKSTAELELGLFDPSSSSPANISTAAAESSYMFLRQALASSNPETSGESVTSTSATTVTTPTTAATTPSPHPSQPSSRPPTVSPTQSFFPSPTLSRADIQTQDDSQGVHDEEVYVRSPTYGSPYANHQNQLYYDSVDSIATLRDNRGVFSSPSGAPGQFQQRRHPLSSSSSPQPQPSPPGTGLASPSPTPSFSSASQRYQRYQQQQQQQQAGSTSTSPTPLSSYPVYQHTPGSPTSPRSAGSPSPQPYYPSSSLHSPTGASLTVLGPSQYRITTAAGPASPGQHHHQLHQGEDGHGNEPEARSPVQRTSSRLTNLTSGESEYQWESAELNHHRWEMMENTHHRK